MGVCQINMCFTIIRIQFNNLTISLLSFLIAFLIVENTTQVGMIAYNTRCELNGLAVGFLSLFIALLVTEKETQIGMLGCIIRCELHGLADRLVEEASWPVADER